MVAQGPETLILGGGPAGAGAAIWLAAAGRRVDLWERELLPGQHKPGDLLGPAALAGLRALGIDVAALGAAPIDHLRLASGGRSRRLRLPWPLAGLSRHRVDGALLDRAQALGVRVERGVAARALAADGTVESSGQSVHPARLLLAAGRRSGLLPGSGDGAGTAAPSVSAETPGLWQVLSVSLRLAPAQRAALSGHLELLPLALPPPVHLSVHLPVQLSGGLGDPALGGLALLHPIEREAASLSLLLPAGWPQPPMAGDAAHLLQQMLQQVLAANPLLQDRLAAAVPLRDRPLLAVCGGRGVRAVAPAPGTAGAIWPLGEAVAAFAGFPNDGVGLALLSARLASAILLMGGTPDSYVRRLAGDVGRRIRGNDWLMAQAAKAGGRDWRSRFIPGALAFSAPFAVPFAAPFVAPLIGGLLTPPASALRRALAMGPDAAAAPGI